MNPSIVAESREMIMPRTDIMRKRMNMAAVANPTGPTYSSIRLLRKSRLTMRNPEGSEKTDIRMKLVLLRPEPGFRLKAVKVKKSINETGSTNPDVARNTVESNVRFDIPDAKDSAVVKTPISATYDITAFIRWDCRCFFFLTTMK